MSIKTIYHRLKAQAGNVIGNLNELYVLALITIGLPAIFYIYFDWRAALTVFILTQIPLGLLRERE